ncbi:MAG: hypothetical protein VB144_09835 [Clostridia bacterium]|nr:hypothetical protein [Clostridia bacterium]
MNTALLDSSQAAGGLVLGALVLGLEYWAKELVSASPAVAAACVLNRRVYWRARALLAGVLAVALAMAFRPGWWIIVVASAQAALAGAELACDSLQARLYLRTGFSFRRLGLVPMLLLVALAANHVVRCMLGKITPHGLSDAPIYPGEEPYADNETIKAGRVIGMLERWIMATFIVLGQYGAIGLTLTAKSIARFSKIEKDPAFAEYYLLGTLFSMVIALLVGLLLKVVV